MNTQSLHNPHADRVNALLWRLIYTMDTQCIHEPPQKKFFGGVFSFSLTISLFAQMRYTDVDLTLRPKASNWSFLIMFVVWNFESKLQRYVELPSVELTRTVTLIVSSATVPSAPIYSKIQIKLGRISIIKIMEQIYDHKDATPFEGTSTGLSSSSSCSPFSKALTLSFHLAAWISGPSVAEVSFSGP